MKKKGSILQFCHGGIEMGHCPKSFLSDKDKVKYCVLTEIKPDIIIPHLDGAEKSRVSYLVEIIKKKENSFFIISNDEWIYVV